MNKLNKLYEAMLKSWGVVFGENYALNLKMVGADGLVPVKVEDKQVYLATSENMNGVTIGKVFFHPACESIMSKETEIFKVIRKLTVAKLYSTFQPLFEIILSVAGKKSGKSVNGKTLEQLEPFKGVNKTLKEEVISIIRQITINMGETGMDTRLVNFSMIKGGKTDNDETAYYTATPSFPFYTELYRIINQNSHLKGSDRITVDQANVSVNAIHLVIALFEMALPACIDPSRKKYSSTSPDAARLVAYLHSYALVAADLNSLIGKFRKEFDSIGIYGIELDWVGSLDEIGEIRNLISSLDYNNYNMTSAPETPAANNGQRISLFNPLAGMFTETQQQNNQQVQQQNQGGGNPPARPEIHHGETYQGVTYSQNNGLYEFRFLQPNGMVRVRTLAEDGRFIIENFVNPMQQQMQSMMPNTGFNPMLQQQQLVQAIQNSMGMIGSGIPMLGMGPQMNGGNWVRDPYTGQMVQSTGQPPQQSTGMNTTGFNNPPPLVGMANLNPY
jgi:hypothetical protein